MLVCVEDQTYWLTYLSQTRQHPLKPLQLSRQDSSNLRLEHPDPRSPKRLRPESSKARCGSSRAKSRLPGMQTVVGVTLAVCAGLQGVDKGNINWLQSGFCWSFRPKANSSLKWSENVYERSGRGRVYPRM